MRRALLLGVLFAPALATAQDFVRVEQTTPFSTTAPVFVPMSGLALSFDARPNELVLLLWKAHLSNSAGGNASTEVLLADDAGTRWGLGSSSGRAANDTELWSSFDWEIGQPGVIHAMVRAVDGGTASVEGFEAVAMRLGPNGQFPVDERFGVVPVNDAQWSVLVSAAVPPGATTTQWLCFAQANVERTQPTGVSLRIHVGTTEFPVPAVPTDPRSRFLSSGATPRMFFYVAPLTLQPNDVVDLEGTVNPRMGGAGSGATADLRDVRLMLIPSTTLEKQEEVAPLSGFSAPIATQAVAAQLPRTTLTAGWELLTMSVLVSGDGGTLDHELITEPGTPPFVSRDVATVSPGVEHPLLSTWVLRPVSGNMQALPQWWTRSLTGGIEGWVRARCAGVSMVGRRWWSTPGFRMPACRMRAGVMRVRLTPARWTQVSRGTPA